MRWRYISGIISLFLLVLALTMATPLVVSVYFKDGAHVSFLWSMVITAAAGLVLKLLSRHMDEDAPFINQKEGMAVVAALLFFPGFCNRYRCGV